MYAKYEITWYSTTTVQLTFIFKTENIRQTFNKNDKLALTITLKITKYLEIKLLAWI